jgi:hypothetical protein
MVVAKPDKPKYEPFPLEILSQADGAPATYMGHCHCGLVKFEVKLSPPFPKHEVIQCNCSVCHRNGYLLGYPSPEDITFLRGKEKMGTYEFKRHQATHKFCPTCGNSISIDFKETFNGRALVGLNVTIELQKTYTTKRACTDMLFRCVCLWT